ncbi:MAG TPA: AI-2E family transporter [Bacteroidales bacterium]|nr:AI-2E family transporter [Bacteroidales bacterium]
MNNRYIGMRLTYFLLSIMLLLYGLIIAKDFLYPLAFGILISYLLLPIVNYFEKKGLPRIAAILITIILAIILTGIITVFVLKRISLFMDELPLFREKTISHIEELQHFIEGEFGIPAERLKNFLLSRIFDIGSQSGKVFSTTTGTIFVILMQPVYVFLFLYYRTKFAYFFLKVVGRQNRMIAVGVLREIALVVTRYMLGVATVVLILCVFNSLGLLIIGIKFPLLLGVISAFFSFIPYFGNFIGGSIPFVFALLTMDSSVYAIRIAVFVYFIHFFENNILSPNIVGNNVRINPFVIILGLILGALIWGLPGMLVAIPFLAMLNIVLKKVPGMQPYVYLLGTRGTRRHALTIENLRRFAAGIKSKWRKNNFSNTKSGEK